MKNKLKKLSKNQRLLKAVPQQEPVVIEPTNHRQRGSTSKSNSGKREVRLPSHLYDTKTMKVDREYPPYTTFEFANYEAESCFGVTVYSDHLGFPKIVKWGKIGGKFNNLVGY